MEAAELLGLASRWLHILSAIVLVGGTLFMRLVTVPAMSTGNGQLDEVRRAMRSRWSRLVGITSGLLILSGVYNLVNIMKADAVPDVSYHMLLTVKLLLALGIFFLASVLAGRSALAEKFRQKETFWLNVVAVMAVVLVCIAGVMKNAPRKPKDSAPETTTAAPANPPLRG